MYAPKFRSWMSSWDRFEEALEHRLQEQGDAIMADVRRQIAEAMPKEPSPTGLRNPYPYPEMLAMLAQDQSAHYQMQQPGGLLWQLGNPSIIDLINAGAPLHNSLGLLPSDQRLEQLQQGFRPL